MTVRWRRTFTPGVSRYRFVYPCFLETTASAIEACEAAWEFYRGVFRTLIPDNTKAIVNKADPARRQDCGRARICRRSDPGQTPQGQGSRRAVAGMAYLPSTTVAVFRRVAALLLGVMLVPRRSLHCVTAFPAAACYPVPVMARSRAL